MVEPDTEATQVGVESEVLAVVELVVVTSNSVEKTVFQTLAVAVEVPGAVAHSYVELAVPG